MKIADGSKRNGETKSAKLCHYTRSYDQNYQPIYRDSVDVDESFDETRFVTPTHEYTNPRDR